MLKSLQTTAYIHHPFRYVASFGFFVLRRHHAGSLRLRRGQPAQESRSLSRNLVGLDLQSLLHVVASWIPFQ
jgi:hypothetical protein